MIIRKCKEFVACPSALAVASYFSFAPALANQVGEAVTDMGNVQNTDPNGYTLMIISISILFLLASTLIGVTTWYMLKGNKKRKA